MKFRGNKTQLSVMRIWYSSKLQRFQGRVIIIFFPKMIISLCDVALHSVMKKLGKAACFVSLYLRVCVCVCVCVFCQTHTHIHTPLS